MWIEVLLAIEHDDLEVVVGGRVDPGPKTCDPKVEEMLGQVAQTFQAGCKSISDGKAQSEQSWQQIIGQMVQNRGH